MKNYKSDKQEAFNGVIDAIAYLEQNKRDESTLQIRKDLQKAAQFLKENNHV